MRERELTRIKRAARGTRGRNLIRFLPRQRGRVWENEREREGLFSLSARIFDDDERRLLLVVVVAVGLSDASLGFVGAESCGIA